MYILTAFGSVNLPLQGTRQYAGTGTTNYRMMPLPAGGMYDDLRGAKSRTQQVTITAEGIVSTLDQNAAALETQIRALRGLIGKRDVLHRVWDSSTLNEWVYARLTSFDATVGVATNLMEVSMSFEQISPCWNGVHHTTGGETTLSSSPKVVTAASVANNGNMHVANPVITVHAGAVPITALNIKGELASSNYWELVYAGTIAATKNLIIDCGTFMCTNDGAADYANFSLGASHTIDCWAKLQPTVGNVVTVTLTGVNASATILIDFFDGHA